MASPRLLVTGANGHLGRLLLRHLDREAPETPVRAVVRSERAAETVRATPLATLQPEIEIVDYRDPASLEAAARDCGVAVHFVGIIKESSTATYRASHEESCGALARAAAAAGLRHLVYLSILGSDPDASNACLASKGRAEQILLRGAVPATVLRVPMVLGPDDHASRSLRSQAQAGLLPLTGGGRTWQQPLDAADLIRVVATLAAAPPAESRAIDLAGPEALPHRDLVARAAALYDRAPTIVPVPVGLVRLFAAIVSRVSSDPPLTPAMLEVLEHDDRVDAAAGWAAVGVAPTPLDETLARYVGPASTATAG